MSVNLDTTWQWKSWVESANDPDCGFPLQNLPLCAFQADNGQVHLGVGVGDQILDLYACARGELLRVGETVRNSCLSPTLNFIMRGHALASLELRGSLLNQLRDDAPADLVTSLKPHLRPMRGAIFHPPVAVPNYTDFYASIHHATNIGRLFRPDQPLLPNYKWVPIGYHGRASSIVVSGTPIRRPHGQIKGPKAAAPEFAPSQQLDFELELGAYIGTGNDLGTPIPMTEAQHHLWGVTLLNDWSARDIQSWEYQPLGPFLGKSFATSVSPWVVSVHALAPFRTAVSSRSIDDPAPLPYLQSPSSGTDALDITLQVHLTSELMRERGVAPMQLTHSNASNLYWSFRQMITHHASNGCNLQPGDLLASGTVSGSTAGSFGCLLEITQRGVHPLTLPSGETRAFLEDGDEITLSGHCRREGLPQITLGECRGRILPAAS